MTGYKPLTTFYMDFSIADNFGASAVKDTYDRAFNEWKTEYKYLTELVMVLNWKIYEHFETVNGNRTLAELYNTLWSQTASFAEGYLQGDELSYYYKTID